MVLLRQLAIWVDGRRRVVAVVLIGWIALVVTGAGQKSEISGRFAIPDLQVILVSAMGLLALCGLVMLPFLIGEQDRQLLSRPVHRIRGLIVVTVLIVVVALAVGPQEFLAEPVEETPAAAESAVPIDETAQDEPGDVESGAFAALLLTIAAAAALLLWSRHRLATVLGDEGDADQETLEAGLASAIDLATDQLLHGHDPRMSVLAAYASLERSLADQGLGRDPHETPTEHLSRVLVAVPVVVGPAVQLGELYEVARFSDHAVTQEDQQRAAVALDRSRSELAALLSASK